MIKEFYFRKEVQRELLRLSYGREVQAWFGDVRGLRPEIVNFEGDLRDLIEQGMTSFHVSEERWRDPLMLKAGIGKKELDDFRIGWDAIVDIDSKNLAFSSMCAELIIDALKFHDLKNYSLKFSGNRGWHIGIPFEAFPKEVNNVNIKDYFPDGVRVISEYLKGMIGGFLSDKILNNYKVEDAARSVGKEVKDILAGGKFNPFSVVDIDSVLISSRHLFRCVYSVNEKSGLVSIPIKDLREFNIEDAKIENVKVSNSLKFLDSENSATGEAKNLLIQAFDWANKNKIIVDEIKKPERVFEIPKVAIKQDYFPPCILKLMSGVQEDGRKRAVFVLVNFLRSVGWSIDEIEKFLLDWNKKNREPLRDGYIMSQISWYRRNPSRLPPNFSNSIYRELGVDGVDELVKILGSSISTLKGKKKL